jgi:hypothetical protein
MGTCQKLEMQALFVEEAQCAVCYNQSSDLVYIFGGNGFQTPTLGAAHVVNELWTFSLSTNLWSWTSKTTTSVLVFSTFRTLMTESSTHPQVELRLGKMVQDSICTEALDAQP